MPDNQTSDPGGRAAHEMRPCPFCGCSTTDSREGPGLHILVRFINEWSAACISCGASLSWEATRAEALAAWNRRAGDDDATPGSGEEG